MTNFYSYENDEFMEKALDNPFVKRYLNEINAEMARCVCMINGTCHTLMEYSDTTDSERTQKIAEDIDNYCKQMMKVEKLNRCLINEPDMTDIGLNGFIDVFVKKSAEIVGSECNFEICVGEQMIFIRSDVDIVKFILLVYIRRMLADNAEKIKISLSVRENYAAVCFEPDYRNFSREFNVDNIIMSGYPEEIIRLILKKVNGSVSYNGKDIEILFPISDGKEFKEESSNNVFNGEDSYSVYKAMLLEFTEPNVMKMR